MKREKNKFYTATKEIKGVTYTAQFNGVRPALEAIDRYKSNEIGFYEYLLSNAIVDPPGLRAGAAGGCQFRIVRDERPIS